MDTEPEAPEATDDMPRNVTFTLDQSNAIAVLYAVTVRRKYLEQQDQRIPGTKQICAQLQLAEDAMVAELRKR